ncbi:hypothetical protein BGZ63DRAFT_405175 [Mariannaea sp. PMI_226]|nr:hypothetical protein BGZ63DRAFT_405175 [Mariannaea sp. PMI_226]
MAVPRNPKWRTACDRCYDLKERCDRSAASISCARCKRLSLTCSTLRPVRPAGRRAHREKDLCPDMTVSKRRALKQYQPDIDASLSVITNQKPEETELLRFFLSQPENMDQYVVCPSFQIEQQHSLAVPLLAGLPLLKDAYLGCAIALKQLQSGTRMDVVTNINLGYISRGMSTLRSLPILRPQDIALCHTLGSALALSIYSAIGVGVPDICQYSLGITSPFAGTAISKGHEDPWETFLIILETMDCFVHRRNPIRRIQVPAKFNIDRHLGLCLPLMPYYYDLCVINNSLLNATDISILHRLQEKIDAIHTFVESWQPSYSDGFVEQFDSAEIVNLLAQAKVYRLGALLMIHRLRYTFGQEDVQAEIWSKEIMMELEMAKRVTKRSMRFVTLPFIVAAVEVRDKSSRFKTLERVNYCVDQFAPFMQVATKEFLLRVWNERDLNVGVRWYDSIHKPCPVMNSIEAICFDN